MVTLSYSMPAVSQSCFLFSDKVSGQLAAILCPVVAMGCVALVILFFICRPRNESCFKQGKMVFAPRTGSVSGVSLQSIEPMSFMITSLLGNNKLFADGH